MTSGNIELLKKLFTWSGLQQGTITPHLRNVDLHECIRRNIMLFIPVAERKQIILKNFAFEHTFVWDDPDILCAFIRNLLSNSLKFSFPGDKISISVTHQYDIVEVTVVQTGVGIRKEDFPVHAPQGLL
jgi:signal transduction histidine kinase